MVLGITRKQLAMVIILLAGAFLTVLNATLLTPALPHIMSDTGVSSTTVQWLTSGYALTEAVVIPLSAFIMGRVPTRKIYIGCSTLFCVGSIVAACAVNFPMILLGRVIQAAATGIIMPMVSSVVLLIFPREKRGSAMGIVGLLIGFAPAIGPTLSGVLIDTVGWRAIFAIVASISLLIIIVSIFVLQNYGSFKRTSFDPLSVVLSTCGLLSLLYGLSSFSSVENHLITLGLMLLGIVLVGLYARRQLSMDEPMLRIGILKTHNYRTVVITVMIFQAALIGMETIMPLYIQGVLGKPATVSGLTLLPGAAIGAITGVFAGRIFDRVGVRPPVLVGAVVISLGAIGFFSLQVDSHIIHVALVYTIMAIGIQFTMTPLNTWGINSLPNDAVQHAQGTSNTLNQVAGSFGTATLVSIASAVSASMVSLSGVEQTFAGYHASFSTTALLAFIAVIIILVFVRDRKKKTAAKGLAAQDASISAKSGTSSELCVRDVMNPQAASVRSDASMSSVIELMSTTETSGVSVIDAKGRLVGYITDGDIMRYLSRQDQNYVSPSSNLYAFFQDDSNFRDNLETLRDKKVMDLATTHVITVEADLPLDKACAVFTSRKIKKAPVSENGVLVGALSRRNIMHYMIDELNKKDKKTSDKAEGSGESAIDTSGKIGPSEE